MCSAMVGSNRPATNLSRWQSDSLIIRTVSASTGQTCPPGISSKPSVLAGKTWVDAIRELPDGAPGKRRYERFLRENGANVSDQDFLVLIAREVYSHIGPLTRKLAPNTLVFGERYSGAAMPWRVIQEALPWIDVLSVQPGGSLFSETDFERAYRETKKPVMICDHQVSFTTPEHSNVMWKTLPDIASVGEAHARFLQDGFSTRYLIGYNRCQYIDRYKGELKDSQAGPASG